MIQEISFIVGNDDPFVACIGEVDVAIGASGNPTGTKEAQWFGGVTVYGAIGHGGSAPFAEVLVACAPGGYPITRG